MIEMSKLPYRDGQAVRFDIKNPSLQLSVPDDHALDVGDFTIETFFEIRSIAETGAVRTVVGKWGASSRSGWKFGVTGKASRRKPQTLVLHAFGTLTDGKPGEAAIFSDQRIELNTPYYAAASVQLAKSGEPAMVTFFLKDLSNDDDPLLTAEIPHDLVGGLSNASALTVGATDGSTSHAFDGLIDDVRLVGRALTVDEILYTVERPVEDTIGYWQFEIDPGVMKNSHGERLNLVADGTSVVRLTAQEAALADFCHALLNSNEFLYVH